MWGWIWLSLPSSMSSVRGRSLVGSRLSRPSSSLLHRSCVLVRRLWSLRVRLWLWLSLLRLQGCCLSLLERSNPPPQCSKPVAIRNRFFETLVFLRIIVHPLHDYYTQNNTFLNEVKKTLTIGRMYHLFFSNVLPIFSVLFSSVTE